MFMKGDKVFDIIRGEGIVESIVNTSFPINVQFSDTSRCTVSYTAEGREFTNYSLPTLYHGTCAPTICAPEPKRMPSLEIDAPIWVGIIGESWKRRHFKRWAPNGKVICWYKGTTSWTASEGQDDGIWSEWKLPEESDDS